MSIETLMTLAVAGLILALAATLRLVALGTMKLVRVLSGDPAPSTRRLGEAVARRSWAERIGGVLQGAGALLVFVVATVASWVRRAFALFRPAASGVGAGGVAAGSWLWKRFLAGLNRVGELSLAGWVWLADRSIAGGAGLGRWWRGVAQPSLVDTRDATLALMTTHPETSGQLEVLERMSPVLHENGTAQHNGSRARSREMQLV